MKTQYKTKGTLLATIRMAALLLALPVSAMANVYDQPVKHIPIPLLDEDGNHVLGSGKAYSTKQTCGGCHDYDAITHAYHFETGRDEARDDYGKLRGFDQLVAPGYFGGYNCMGSNNPDRLAKKSNASVHDFADKGSAGWIMRCEGCHAGGGWMEKDRLGRRYDEVDPTTVDPLDGDYYNRGTDENNQFVDDLSVVSQWDWKKSGVVENNCLKCHADVNALIVPDPNIVTRSASRMVRNVRRSVLIDQGYFRESNTAILEALNLNLSGDPALDQTLVSFTRADLDGDGEIEDKEVVFDPDTGEPQFTWNAAAFDADRKVEIPMLRFPGNDNCMACHSTSNSRRGFYGFGEGAEATYDEEDGTLVEDYQDDVHKGKTWREGSEERTIENCNACHARNYFKPASSNVDLSADHNFLKGNSDMDVHNDRDFNPNAKSCEYCHEDSPLAAELANPSGDATMLEAHLKRWTLAGDMSGYPQAELERITQSHLDVVSCQACHITDKKARGRAFQPMFRYREDAEGRQTIVPYKPKPRYYWRDRNSGTVLTKTERNSVYREIRDADGNLTGGEIFDPETGEVLATVSARISHGSVRYGDPDSYEAFVGLKQAYDKVLKARGVENPDAVLVWSEINQYLISHNTRPAVSSVQCEECHNYKSDGTTISALVSNDGIFGTSNSYEITTLVDPRLVTEGIVTFEYPYMKMDENGVVTENAMDILSYSRLDPSMTILRAAIAPVAVTLPTEFASLDEIRTALADLGLDDADVQELADRFRNSNAYLFRLRQGDDALRKVAVMASDSSLAGYNLQVALADDATAQSVATAGLGGLAPGGSVYSLEMSDDDGVPVSRFSQPLMVKIPYAGTTDDPSLLRIVSSADGRDWEALPPDALLSLQPAVGDDEGYVVFATDHFSYYALTDTTLAGSTDTGSDSADDSSGGGLLGYPWLLGAGLLLLLRRRRHRC